jgi:hypothetical protein
MFKLGKVNTNNRRDITFKEWLKNGAKAGRYTVEYIFLPRKFPSITFIFRTEDGRVRLTLAEEKGKEILKAFNFKKMDTDFSLVFFMNQDGEYGFDKREGEEKLYFRKWGWSIYPEKQTEGEIDIEL